MKTFLFLPLALLAASCSSEVAKPDPRVATIHQQHEQLLTQQKQYVTLLPTLTGPEKLSPAHIKDSEQRFADMVQQSQDNLTALDQLDPAKAQDPAQTALVGELAAKEAGILARGTRRLANVHDEHYLP